MQKETTVNYGTASVETAWLDHLDGGRIWYYDVKGVRTRSLEAGDDGPPIVLLHGTGGHAETFLRNVVPLAKRGYRTFAIDMIGAGMTDKPALGDGYELADYVDHLLAFIETLGLSDVTIVGESLGGWVAMRAALGAPELIARVVNVTGGGLRFGEPTPEEKVGWKGLYDRSIQAIDNSSWETWRARMNWLVNDPADMPDELVAVREFIFSRPEMKGNGHRLYHLLATLLDGHKEGVLGEGDLAKVAVPVLYLWTEHNPTTPLQVAQHAQSVTPGSRFVLMEDCGHWPQWEKADEYNDLVDEFIRE
jgi:2-hydroxy-6-oxonona-2,4-dienedioate hydrolase